MSVTPLDPPGGLASFAEPIDFTTTSTAATVVISVSFPTYRQDDTAFINGAFTARYAANSSWTDSGSYRTFHVLRDGGWPAAFALFVVETALAHETTHLFGGSDPLSGELIAIATGGGMPAHYTPTTTGSAAANVAELGAHLQGIDNLLGTLSTSVAANTASLTTLSSAVTTNTTNISTNTSNITTLTAAAKTIPHTDQSGSRTLVLGDAGTKVRMIGGGALTVPTHASVAFNTDTIIFVKWAASTQPSIAAAGGVTINQTKLKLAALYDGAALTYVGSDVWDLEGSLST